MSDLRRPFGNLPLKTAGLTDKDRRHAVGPKKVPVHRGASVFARHIHGNGAYYPATVVAIKGTVWPKYEVKFLRDGSKDVLDQNHVFPMFVGDSYKIDSKRKDIWPTVGKFTVAGEKNWEDRDHYLKGHMWLGIPSLPQPTSVKNTAPQTIVVGDDPVLWEEITNLTFLASDDNKLIINCRALSKGGMSGMLIADQFSGSGLIDYRGNLNTTTTSYATRDIDKIFYLYTPGTAMWLKIVLKNKREHVFAMIASEAARHNLLCIINVLCIELHAASYREQKDKGLVAIDAKGTYADYASGDCLPGPKKATKKATSRPQAQDFDDDETLEMDAEDHDEAYDEHTMPAPKAKRTPKSNKASEADNDRDEDYIPPPKSQKSHGSESKNKSKTKTKSSKKSPAPIFNGMDSHGEVSEVTPCDRCQVNSLLSDFEFAEGFCVECTEKCGYCDELLKGSEDTPYANGWLRCNQHAGMARCIDVEKAEGAGRVVCAGVFGGSGIVLRSSINAVFGVADYDVAVLSREPGGVGVLL